VDGLRDWFADQHAAFILLEGDGCVLAVSGPLRPSDARLRRAGSRRISRSRRELISQQLAGRADNQRVLVHGFRFLLAYQLSDGTKIWVTEADPSRACILLPQDALHIGSFFKIAMCS
jgi:hypothetical protein